MQILCDEYGYVASFAMVGTLTDGVEISEPEDVDHFREHFQSYRLCESDYIIYDAAKEKTLAGEERIAEIRRLREQECFPVINRGKFWYDQLNDEQRTELATWYQAWLDATKTDVMPDKPGWL